MITGTQSITFEKPPYLISSASVVGKKEGQGPLGKMFDIVGEDDLFGADSWEEAESTMQKEACLLAMGKAHISQNQVRCLFGGDLLRQGVATSMGVEELEIPMVWGIYAGSNFQPFWKRRERISIPFKLCEPTASICTLDSDRQRCVSRGDEEEPRSDYWCNDREDRGLWAKGRTEYGSMYGTCSL